MNSGTTLCSFEAVGNDRCSCERCSRWAATHSTPSTPVDINSIQIVLPARKAGRKVRL